MSENKPKMKSALMLGVNPNTEREINDFYATDSYAMELVLPVLKCLGLSENVWENACGAGNLSKVLTKNGYNVRNSDIVDRGYSNTEVIDFLSYTEPYHNGDILTNPPFKYAVDFIKKSMELLDEGHKAIFFLKLQFLETEKRKKLFAKYPPKYVIVHSERIFCAMNADFSRYASHYDDKKGKWCGGTQCYCWFVFEKGYKGDSKLLWV